MITTGAPRRGFAEVALLWQLACSGSEALVGYGALPVWAGTRQGSGSVRLRRLASLRLLSRSRSCLEKVGLQWFDGVYVNAERDEQSYCCQAGEPERR